ncbi:hypothetical protein U1737_19370 [Sphingomonas sp. LB3N6]|uniref:hypothetical protein n=1 Tax=Sphingomonas fucosidasi TaxID=3096164 RepID=UPI002FC6D2E1
MRYNLPIADNIAVGRIEARGDRERIEAAASATLADRVVAKLPYGYDRMIGKQFRNGVDLSASKWQKMAIARAYPDVDPRRTHSGLCRTVRASGCGLSMIHGDPKNAAQTGIDDFG